MDDPRRKGARAPTYGDRNDDRRWASPALGVPETVEDEDCTAQYEREEIDADELKERRAKRPTDKRLEKLETDRDDMRKDIGDIKVDVGEMRGEVRALLKISTDEKVARESREKREAEERASKRANIVPIIKAIGTALAIAGAAIIGAIAGHS